MPWPGPGQSLGKEGDLTHLTEGTPRRRGPFPEPSSERQGGRGVATDRSIRVVIVHDQRLIRESLHVILSSDESVEIVGDSAPGLPSIDVIQELHPDVVLLDIGTSEMAPAASSGSPMRFPAAFLMRILKAAGSPEEPRGRMFVVVRRGYAYLQEELQQAFEGQEDVRVVVDRREGERRRRREPVTTERRQADQHRSEGGHC